MTEVSMLHHKFLLMLHSHTCVELGEEQLKSLLPALNSPDVQASTHAQALLPLFSYLSFAFCKTPFPVSPLPGQTSYVTLTTQFGISDFFAKLHFPYPLSLGRHPMLP